MCAVCARLVSMRCNHWYTAFLAVTFFFRGQPELSDVMWSFVCDTRIILAIAVISSRCGVVSRQHTSNLVPSFMLNIFFLSFGFVCLFFQKKISREGNLNLFMKEFWPATYDWIAIHGSRALKFCQKCPWKSEYICQSLAVCICLCAWWNTAFFDQYWNCVSRRLSSAALYCTFIQHAMRTLLGLDLKLSRSFLLGAVQNLRWS